MIDVLGFICNLTPCTSYFNGSPSSICVRCILCWWQFAADAIYVASMFKAFPRAFGRRRIRVLQQCISHGSFRTQSVNFRVANSFSTPACTVRYANCFNFSLLPQNFFSKVLFQCCGKLAVFVLVSYGYCVKHIKRLPLKKYHKAAALITSL